MRRVFTPILAASLIAAPISASAAAPATSAQAVPADARAGAELGDAAALEGVAWWVIGLVALAVIVGIILLVDDDDDAPVSP
jgi:hypothetical protein